MNFDNFDLNLIRVFLAIAKHGNVTEAGKQLGLTQSSVSHSLARLRALCNDQLFVRTSDGMVPTVTGQAMIEPLERALDAVHASLRGSLTFDPSADARSFNILLTDIGQLSYLPTLAEYLSKYAPRVSINVQPVPIDGYHKALISGSADFAIGHLPTLQTGFHQRVLFETPYVCMLRADHPKIKDEITLEQYRAASHIVVEPPGRGPGVVEHALARARIQRNIVMRLPHFFAGPLIVRRTDYVMTVPLRSHFAESELYNIQFLPLPFDVEIMTIKLLWHERIHNDEGHRWLRGVIASLFADSRDHAHV